MSEDYLQEWPLDAKGRRHRDAARVVFLDAQDNVLLLHGLDEDDPVNHRWWFTVGGGKQTGEDSRAAAVREAFEETGWRINAEQLVGPVLLRESEFVMLKKTLHQSEEFFLYRLDALKPEPDTSGFTQTEQTVVSQLRWFSLAELDAMIAAGHVVYPLALANYLRKWINGWDGEVDQIREGTVGPKPAQR